MEIKVGDIVKVVHTGATYSTYREWYEEYLSGIGYYIDNESPVKGEKYEVVAVAPHGTFGGTIYGLKEINTKCPQVFIIGRHGIELLVSLPELPKEVLGGEFKIGARVMGLEGTRTGEVGTVIGYGSSKKSICVEFDEWNNGHNACDWEDVSGERTGRHCWFVTSDDIELLEEVFEMKAEDKPVYKVGEFLRCVSRTGKNVEGLILGEVYEMVGASMYDGNLVLSVKDKSGKLIHTIDRFESVDSEKVTEDDIYIMKCDIAPEGYGTDVLKSGVDTLMSNSHFGKIPEGKVGYKEVGINPNPDMVNDPPHYKTGGIECIDYLEAKMGKEAFEGFCIGNTLKYLSRLGHKGDRVEDMAKAQFYLNKAVSLHTAPTEPTEVSSASNRPITSKQIGFIAGLTKKLKIDRYDMPEYISPLYNYKELSEAEASIVIDKLIAIKDYKEIGL